MQSDDRTLYHLIDPVALGLDAGVELVVMASRPGHATPDES